MHSCKVDVHVLLCAVLGQASYKPAMSLYIALCSFNLAKNAGSALDRSELAEIYATVAVGLRAVIPSYIPLWPITVCSLFAELV